MLANLFFAIPLNTLLSRFKPWRMIAFFSLGVGVFGLMQGWSPTLAVLLIGRVVAGMCFTSQMASRALLIQQWTPKHRLAFTNGVWFGGVDLGMGIAYFITPLILVWLGGWRGTFYFWGGVALLMAVVWVLFGKERETAEYSRDIESQEKTPLTVILKYPEIWILGMGMIGAMLGSTGFQLFWPTLAEEKLGLSTTVIGVTLGLQAMSAAPTAFLVNAIPTLVRKQPLGLGLGGVSATAVFLALLYVDSPPLVMLLGLAEGVSRAYFPVLMIMVFQMPNIKPREVGVGLAFIETCIRIGSAIGALVIGFVEEATGDLRLAIIITSFSPLILIVSAVLLHARRWSPLPKVPVPEV